MMTILKDPRFEVELSSYAGFAIGAEHFYVSLTRKVYLIDDAGNFWQHRQNIELFREVGHSEAIKLAKKDRGWKYAVSHRFNSEEEALAAAVAVFELVAEEGDFLTHRGEVLAGVEREFKSPNRCFFGANGPKLEERLPDYIVTLRDGIILMNDYEFPSWSE